MTCAREGCDASLDGLRSDARYCSSACKSAAWKARHGYEVRTPYQTQVERLLGRRLQPSEVIHHIDGDHRNLDPVNLALLPNQSVHACWHNGSLTDAEMDSYRLVKSCVCGCGELSRPAGRYATDACRARDWKARVRYGSQRPFERPQARIQRAARPSDVRPTFTRVYEVLARELGSPLRARDLAEQMLTDKQRARVRELGL